MFGRKIPDKVMSPGTSEAGTEGQRMEKNAAGDRGAAGGRNEAPRRANTSGMGSVLGEDTVLLGGKIVSKGTLRVDGRLEAEIEAEDSIIVGPNGIVKANVSARSVAISGKVYGNIVAHERLELQPTSEVYGDIQTAPGALIIEGGAKLEGHCTMGLDAKKGGESSAKPKAVQPAQAASKDAEKAAS
jgi:cytoskeletal protein CcmA (bactofilin family)